MLAARPLIASAVLLLTVLGNADSGQSNLDVHIKNGRKKIEQFFGSSFSQPFELVVCADRKVLDAYFQERWHFISEAWMVAAGVNDALVILDPAVWNTQSVEHDGNDSKHVQQIVTHELVHVFHGQHNPTGDFEGVDEIAWFVEGLATYASGQLEQDKDRDALRAIDEGKAPRLLGDAWSGRYRYGVCGSMAKYIDVTYGRKKVVDLLSATKQSQILKSLGTTEDEFILDWMSWVMRG